MRSLIFCLLVMPALACASGRDTRRQAERQVIEATRQVRQMTSDPRVRELLSQAKGVFIGSGAAGVFLEKRAGLWGAPLFYDIGSLGTGRIALLLMNEQAVLSFREAHELRLSSVVMLWSARNGVVAASGGVISGIQLDQDATRAFYQRGAGPDTGRALRRALSN
jgi:lipid-binding SYLF domain-containing protein